MKQLAVAMQVIGLACVAVALGALATWLGFVFGGMAVFAVGAKLESEVD